MIKRLLKTIIIAVLVVFVAYMIVSNIAFFHGSGGSYNTKTIIDADSGHDMDGLFALVRILIDNEVQVVGLISGQWNLFKENSDSSVLISQEKNERILDLLNLTHIAHPIGADEMLYVNEKPVPQPSEGAKFIIENAQGLASGEKLRVITLGSTTNLASAILMDSSIIPNLDCYILGLKYDPFRKAWNKNEFNTRNDLDAIDVILNEKNLNITVMPANVSGDLKFQKTEISEKLRDKGNIWTYLLERWDKDWPDHQEYIMQDVALVEAILHPKFATIRELYTPPENTRRKIRVYTRIKTEAMIKDYWKAVEEYSGY